MSTSNKTLDKLPDNYVVHVETKEQFDAVCDALATPEHKTNRFWADVGNGFESGNRYITPSTIERYGFSYDRTYIKHQGEIISYNYWNRLFNNKEYLEQEKYTIQQCIDQKIAIRCYSPEEGRLIMKNYNKDHSNYDFLGSNDFEIFPTDNRCLNWQPNYKGRYMIENGIYISDNKYKKATKCIEFKQLILDNMDNKGELLGYKIKDDYLLMSRRAFDRSLDWSLQDGGTHFKKGSAYEERFEEAKVLDIWCDKVYGIKYSLPQINGYSGQVGNNKLVYGCAEFDINWFKTIDIDKAVKIGINRTVKSFVLDSGVTITFDQVKQIRDYLNNVK